MDSIATTIRLDPDLKNGLIKLSKLRSTTLNKTINMALRAFVARDALALREEIEASVAELLKLAEADPHFDAAIERAVRAETLARGDPAQGVVSEPADGSVTNLVRGVLGA